MFLQSELPQCTHKFVPRRTDFESEISRKFQEAFGAAITTVMIKNIPNRYTQTSLLAEIDALGFADSYDFCHMPIDMVNACNVGYAFVNFARPESARPSSRSCTTTGSGRSGRGNWAHAWRRTSKASRTTCATSQRRASWAGKNSDLSCASPPTIRSPSSSPSSTTSTPRSGRAKPTNMKNSSPQAAKKLKPSPTSSDDVSTSALRRSSPHSSRFLQCAQ
jgi:hypothetical protein